MKMATFYTLTIIVHLLLVFITFNDFLKPTFQMCTQLLINDNHLMN